MTIDFDTLGNDLQQIGANGKIVFGAVGRIYQTYQKLEPTTRASLIADVRALSAQMAAIGDALDALEQDDDVQKLGGAVQLAITVGHAVPVAARVGTDLKSVVGADYAVIKPDAVLIFSTLKGTTL